MDGSVDRRGFLKSLAAVTAAGVFDIVPTFAAGNDVSPAALPRWRGFTLLDKSVTSGSDIAFREMDFAWIAEWGFNFVRVPLSYRCWSDPQNWRQLREGALKQIDRAVEFGRRYGIHVSLCFHRAPGHSADHAAGEPLSLWTDAEALEACAYHWRHFAQRYRDVPNTAVSFNLLNEPAMKSSGELLDDLTYQRVVAALVAAIREESPARLIIADGLLWGSVPVPALAGLGIAQSAHTFDPIELTHWKADWVAGSSNWPEPTWPLPVAPETVAGRRRQYEQQRRVFANNPIMQRTLAELDPAQEWNRERIQRQLIRPWQELQAMGVGVHFGGIGAYRYTPHDVTLRWMRDVLGLYRQSGFGWATWDFRGPLGILNSARADVGYDDFHGQKLDRAMLELLRAS